MTVALLFPGQGTQREGLLPWLESSPAAAAVLGQLAAALGNDWRPRLADASWAHANRVAQSLVTGTSLAAWAAVAPGLPRVVAVAGYSVGEVAACAAAGMLSVAQALSLAGQRAAAMDRGARGGDAGLLALSGVTPADLAETCARWDLDVAIRIGPERCIVGGATAALVEAARHLTARAVQATLLDVHVASHTRAMSGVVSVLHRVVASFDWQAPRIAWVAGSRGAVVRELADVRQALAEQVAQTVRWGECMDTVAERRPDCVLEVGPGTTLARMWRERHPAVPVRSCDEFQSVDEVLGWVARPGRE